jgi:hypothetical protein
MWYKSGLYKEMWSAHDNLPFNFVARIVYVFVILSIGAVN